LQCHCNAWYSPAESQETLFSAFFSNLPREVRAVFSNFVHRLDCFFPELGKLVKEHVFSILFKTQHREKTATWQCHRKGVSMIG